MDIPIEKVHESILATANVIKEASKDSRKQFLEKVIVILGLSSEDLRGMVQFNSKKKHAYYNRSMAEAAKGLMDAIVKSGKSQDIFYSDYPNQTPHTIKTMVWNGIQYLLDNMDPTNIYRQTYATIDMKVIMSKGKPFSLRLIKLRPDTDNKAFKFRESDVEYLDVNIRENSEWQEQVLEFIQSDGDDKIQIKGQVKFDANDVQWVKDLFITLEEYSVVMSPEALIIRKGIQGLDLDQRIICWV